MNKDPNVELTHPFWHMYDGMSTYQNSTFCTDLYLSMFQSICVFMCIFKLPDCEKAFEHSGHL